ncbi:MAG: DUF4886 domain-containing protein [Clostridiales bacterium]|nr:DUF4886 domain-containing protein [Clostridiales bacterium]
MGISIISIGDEHSVSPCRYLTKIAKCDGVEITAGSLLLANGTIKRHYESLINDVSFYRFDYYKKGSSRCDSELNYSLAKALTWEDWNYITIQQAGDETADAGSFSPYLKEFKVMLKEMCPDSILALNETWDFRSDGQNQKTIDEMSRNAYVTAAKEAEIDIVLPVGDAFRIARDTSINSYLSEEGCYGSRMEEFLAGAVWYELLTGNDITKNKYRLPFVEGEYVQVLKEIAHSVAQDCNLRRQ